MKAWEPKFPHQSSSQPLYLSGVLLTISQLVFVTVILAEKDVDISKRFVADEARRASRVGGKRFAAQKTHTHTNPHQTLQKPNIHKLLKNKRRGHFQETRDFHLL